MSIADDAARVQRFWAYREPDPQSIKPAHAALFFELVEMLGAQGLMFSGFDTEPLTDQSVQVERITRPPNSAPKPKLEEMISDIELRLERFAPHAIIISPSVPEIAIARLSRQYPALYYQSGLFWPMHWGTERRGVKIMLRKALRVLRLRRKLRYIRGVISTSENVARQFSVACASTIPNGFDIPQFADPYPVAPRLKARNLVFLSPVTEDNRVFDLVNIVQEMAVEIPEIQLVMAGMKGDAYERLEALVASIPEITLEPKPSHQRFRSLLSEADLCITSLGERSRFGSIDFQFAAALSGVPSLVSSNTPLSDYLRPGCQSYSVSDPDALRQAIRSLVLDDEAYQRLAAQVPTDSGVNFDRTKSFGSEIGRLLLEMVV